MELFTVQETAARQRLDLFLAEQGVTGSRTQIQKWIEEERVTVNGFPVKAGYRLKEGDRVSVDPKTAVPLALEPEPIPLTILQEDRDLLVIDKPAGLVVHPAPGNYSGTLVQALLHHCRDLSGIGGVLRPGIVHRLDKETSGLLVVAKNDQTHRSLIQQFQSGEVIKEYQALVWGYPAQRQGRIDRPIGRHPVHRKKMAITEARGKPALTEWEIEEMYPAGFSRLRVRIKTGRTHQIRVHLSAVGLPVLGDSLYGPAKGRPGSRQPRAAEVLSLASRQMLHAARLSFVHPRTFERLAFEAPLPADVIQVIDLLKKS
ncbi:MAG: RluA family pseudouridine synthase [Deltaproteobacteria bacterium]|nr:RluA family pseudouridine synthase [Deltaproteobacteria bacterium]